MPDSQAASAASFAAAGYSWSTATKAGKRPDALRNTGGNRALPQFQRLEEQLHGPARRTGRALAAPVTAIGTMSLTAYVAHILVIRAPGIEDVPGSPLWVLCCFVVAVMVFAMAWKRHFRRGPLESLLNTATAPAAHIR
ncbi:DUF418 domain-containing protein [Streptomyces rimosus]|uniref:DUF418 domain-containing protein n=1 Tax=Streptomyces rimosus TaxID=1927 RepID=UPI0031D8E1DA